MLSIFTRYPEAGTTKTRLIPALGAESAASLQQAMTRHVLSVAGRVARDRNQPLEVRYAGGDEARMREAFGASLTYRPQGDGTLGERMQRCVRAGLASGAEDVVIVGSDIPGIDTEILHKALDALRDHELVLGPSADGGYYLIGLHREVPDLFRDIPWGSEDVLRRTLARAKARGLAVALLAPLADVDRPEDLALLEQYWGKPRVDEALARISVILPALNEAAALPSVLQPLSSPSSPAEVIVVDAGSTDGTREAAAAHGATVIGAAAGRARQMNAGAARATGGILLFLHADTRLPGGYQQCLRHALALPGVIGGAFRFQVDAEGRGFRVLERWTHWRARVLQMPYGDQALFMTARTFAAMNGFPDLPIMEDFEMVRRLRRRGRIHIVSAPAITSARRWRQRGMVRTTLLNQCMILGYGLGIPPRLLARWYRGGTASAERCRRGSVKGPRGE